MTQGRLRSGQACRSDKVRDAASPPSRNYEVGDRPKCRAPIPEDAQGVLRLRHQGPGTLSRLLKPKKAREGGLPLAQVAPCPLAKRLQTSLQIEDIVHDLEGEPDPVTIPGERLHLFGPGR